MGQKRGRKGVYETKIKPFFPEISEWVKNGVFERDIAKNLGVGYSTFNRYKSEKEEFREILKNNRESCVEKIENAMFTAATGEVRTVKKFMKCRRVEYENGKRKSEKEIMVPYEEEIYIPPNTTAAIYLLKHWGRDKGYTNDPASLEIRRKELKLKEKIAEANNWLEE